ncbi:MAG: hypothetical protein RR232_06890 [Clostridia bacterium]
MKRFISLLCVICTLMLLCSCAVAQPHGTPDKTPEPTIAPNPMVEADAASLSAMGLPLSAPSGATHVARRIIEGNIAELAFSLNGSNYVYRASNELYNISGKEGEIKKKATFSLNLDSVDYSLTIDVFAVRSGGMLAIWSFPPASFTLYCTADTDPDGFGSLASYLADTFHYNTHEGGTSALGNVSPADFIELFGIYIDAPAGASDIGYRIYDDSMALVDFTYEERIYELRAQKYPGVPAVSVDFEQSETIDVQSNWFIGDMTLKYTQDKDGAMIWGTEGVNYCLYVKNGVDPDKLPALALQLAIEIHRREIAANEDE